MTNQKYPEPTAGELIINQEGKIFLMKSHKWHGQYVIPEGHIELGETIEEAEEYIWATVEEALKLQVEHYTRVVIEKYLEKRHTKLS